MVDLLSLLFVSDICTSGNRPFLVDDFGEIPVLLSEFQGFDVVTTIFGDACLLVRDLPGRQHREVPSSPLPSLPLHLPFCHDNLLLK